MKRRTTPAAALGMMGAFALIMLTVLLAQVPTAGASSHKATSHDTTTTKPATSKQSTTSNTGVVPDYKASSKLGHFKLSGQINASWSLSVAAGCSAIQTSSDFGVEVLGVDGDMFAALPDSPKTAPGHGASFPSSTWGALIRYTSPTGAIYVWDASGGLGTTAATGPAAGADGSGNVTLTKGFYQGSVKLKLQPGGPHAAFTDGAANLAVAPETITGRWSCAKKTIAPRPSKK